MSAQDLQNLENAEFKEAFDYFDKVKQGIKDSQFDVPRFPQSVSVSQSIVSQSVNCQSMTHLLFVSSSL